MARKSDALRAQRATQAIVDQTSSTAGLTKKRKKKERETTDAPDVDGASVNADACASESGEHGKRKKKKRRAEHDNAQEPTTAANAVDQHVVVDDTSATPPEHSKQRKTKKKKDGKGKHRSDTPMADAQIDPVLSALDGGNSTNAFLSAVVAAAAGPVVQDHSQTAEYPRHSSSFDTSGYQNVPPAINLQHSGLDGLGASLLGEDLARVLQGFDVAKLADALQALGDAGSSSFPLPGQSGPNQAGVGSLQRPPQTRHVYDHGTMAQPVAMIVDTGSGNGHGSQTAASSEVILGHPTRNTEKDHTSRRVASTTVSHFGPEEHAHLLANKWFSATKLNELTKTTGLQYKKGKFSTSEEALIKGAIETYRERNGLTHEQLNELIFAKGPKSKDNAFWFDITAQVPSRPVVAVYHHVRRSLHPMKQQGKWMPAEDDVLRQAVADLGQSWEKVSQRVGRMASDCRDRWRNHLNNREGRVFGAWSKEEEDQLTQIVTELTTAQGKNSDLDVFWTQVAARMGNTRGRHQCRIKWTDSLSKTVKNAGQKPRWSQQDAYILVHKIASLNVFDDSEIDWKLLTDHNWNLWSAHTLQRRWLTLKRSVRGHEEMTHQEIMDILRIKKAHPPPPSAPVRPRVTSAPLVPVDAQALDVAIEDTFPLAGPSGFGDLHATAFGEGSMNANQPQPHFGNFANCGPQAGLGQTVVTENDGAGPSNVQNSENSSLSSSSDAGVSDSD